MVTGQQQRLLLHEVAEVVRCMARSVYGSQREVFTGEDVPVGEVTVTFQSRPITEGQHFSSGQRRQPGRPGA